MSRINIIGFPQAGLVNDLLNFVNQDGVDIDVLLPDDFLAGRYETNSRFINAVTKDLELRLKINSVLDQQDLERYTYIHASCVIDPSAEIGAGSFLGPFTGVYHNVKIGKDCIVGPYSMLSHNASLGNNCLLNPGVIITGTTKIGDNCKFGVRSTVLDQLTICDNVFVGAASTINKTIAEAGQWVGSPARRVS
jgi:UDP-3-O-[3-hydroxymyristoyl] glucosamine N-acyltransferase